MIEAHVTRRGFLAAVAAGTAIAWIEAHASELRVAAALAARPGDDWLVLTADQAAQLDAITAQLIPTDETPGAREAKVVRFIDRSLATFMQDDQGQLAKVLDELAQTTAQVRPGSASFVALAGADQIAVLQEFEKSHKDSFGGLRYVTILGMMSDPSYGGNVEKSGWKMIGFVDQFAWSPPFGFYDRA